MTVLTRDLLRELLDYDPLTGVFTWKFREQKWFDDYRIFRVWNSKWAFKIAGYVRKDGYIGIEIFTVPYLAHRVAWIMFFGGWPQNLLDHKNQIRHQNSIFNLRIADESINAMNRKLPNNNTSGHVGINLCGGRFRASIKRNGKRLYLGTYDTFEEAVSVRKNAESAHGFSLLHGAVNDSGRFQLRTEKE